jgi:hypothetical protein
MEQLMATPNNVSTVQTHGVRVEVLPYWSPDSMYSAVGIAISCLDGPVILTVPRVSTTLDTTSMYEYGKRRMLDELQAQIVRQIAILELDK